MNTESAAIEKEQQRIKNINNKFQETVKMTRGKLRAIKRVILWFNFGILMWLIICRF